MKDGKIAKRKLVFRSVNRKLRRLFPSVKTALCYSNPWELLVATILSAQTTDVKVNQITANLFRKYKSVKDYARADPSVLAQDIRGVNYHITKAKHIAENAKIVLDRFGGKVPDTMDDLLILKGVARKTANIVLANAYGVLEGIAVDTHVKRLVKLHGLTEETDPVKIEKDLMAVVPKKEWRDFPLRLIEYGRKYCVARPHGHSACPLQRLSQNSVSSRNC